MSEATQPESIKVLVVDDDLMVRETLADYLATASDLELVGSCSDGEAAVQAVRAGAVDVVLMDIRMPGMDGVTATVQILRVAPRVRVVALTTFDTDDAVAGVFEAGGAGFLLKNTRPAALVAAVRAAHRGVAVIPPELISRWNPQHSVAVLPALAAREREVLAAVATGLTNRDIAAQLYVSQSTVKFHLASLMRKLGADNRTGLVARAHEVGLL